MNEWTGLLCLGTLLFIPIATFVLGYLIGGNKLPFRVRIERNTAIVKYEVDDGQA